MTAYVSVADIARRLGELRYLDDSTQLAIPKMCDRIYLGNVPHYVGMELFAFTYAAPLLEPHSRHLWHIIVSRALVISPPRQAMLFLTLSFALSCEN